MKKVRWGILGTANIATEKVLPAMQQGTYCDITAIASRSLEKARAAATQFGIPKAYGSYEELLADPEIDAIYNPLPNHLHVPWSIKALEAGKHVLCEKPIALTAAEAEVLAETARQYPHLKVMEAFMYRFHPQWQRARLLVREEKIGTLRTISHSSRTISMIRTMFATGLTLVEGAVLDVGCYTISLARFIFGDEPKRVFGIVEYDPQFMVDRLASGVMDFELSTATFTCGTQLSSYQRVNIFGTEGRIEIEIPFECSPRSTLQNVAPTWRRGRGDRAGYLQPIYHPGGFYSPRRCSMIATFQHRSKTL